MFANTNTKSIQRADSACCFQKIFFANPRNICMISETKKQTRVDWSHEMLQRIGNGILRCVFEIVTGNECYIYQSDLESKIQSPV